MAGAAVSRHEANTVYFGATALTGVTDNAALTYLGSLVDGLSDEFKYALVAGSVTGGGLTVIANAPNPAGFAISRGHFDDETIHPLGLLLADAPAHRLARLSHWPRQRNLTGPFLARDWQLRVVRGGFVPTQVESRGDEMS